MTKISRQELTERIYGATHRINLDNAEKREPVYTLPDMLSHKNITSLRRLAKLHRMSRYSKMDKPAIIPALIEKMTNPDILSENLLLTEDMEWNLFKKAVKAEQVNGDTLLSDNYRYLLELGLIALYYYEGHFRYVVAREIRATYIEMEKSAFAAEKEYSDLLNAYAVAAVNLYGVIRQEDFVTLFNSQNSRKTDIDEMFSVLIRYVSMDYGYCFWEDYIVDDDFAENEFENVKQLAAVAASKPRYVPPKRELLNFSDWGYIEETPQLKKLRGYINRNLSDDTDLTEDILEEIYFLCKCEATPQRCIDVFQKNQITFEFDQLQEIFDLIFDLKNNIRLWLNNGHTPNELFAAEQKHLRPLPKMSGGSKVKTGRNDPCPCGSGKKYKKCCGM